MLLLLSAVRAIVRVFTPHTPASRIFIVPAESRSARVLAESRVYHVPE